MKRFLALACWLFFIFLARAQSQTSPAPPTWQEEIAKGRVPYHQLAVNDFRIDDAAHPESAFWVKPFIEYRYNFLLKPYNGFGYAYVTDWIVFSGLDKNETSRKSKSRAIKDELPFAQALLDICELHARELAALKPGELPGVRAETYEGAKLELEKRIKMFCQPTFDQIKMEEDAFLKATKKGQKGKKVRELAGEIRKRLEAAPVTPMIPNESKTVPGPAPTAAPTPWW